VNAAATHSLTSQLSAGGDAGPSDVSAAAPCLEWTGLRDAGGLIPRRVSRWAMRWC